MMTEPEKNYADARVRMKTSKQKKLEAAGWKVGSASEFLQENYADAVVLCKDGKYRTFVAAADEVLHYEARKYTYLLMPEPEGRGFVTMRATADMGPVWEYVVAPERMQPVKIEAKTRAGHWNWEVIG